MKPYPLELLNHFTIPFTIMTSCQKMLIEPAATAETLPHVLTTPRVLVEFRLKNTQNSQCNANCIVLGLASSPV